MNIVIYRFGCCIRLRNEWEGLLGWGPGGEGEGGEGIVKGSTALK